MFYIGPKLSRNGDGFFFNEKKRVWVFELNYIQSILNNSSIMNKNGNKLGFSD